MSKMAIKVHESQDWKQAFEQSKAEATELCQKVLTFIKNYKAPTRGEWGCVGSMNHIKNHLKELADSCPGIGGTSEANELPPSSDWKPTVKKIKDLKKGEWFTLKPIEEPKESQVWELQGYDPSDKMYWAIRWSNISDSRDFKGDREVYTDFTF